ncbi:MAG: hypothetical protein US71_C0012G0006 [Parcubacteria group bacterium GW2011_GWD2_38_12]|nr:MAG: hypothetical protein US06_C0009G0021 [Parcubacteria group bacterium GW2011_GWC2_36_17]KKQ38858.1 MAG: hypothetical protein US56_C0034G0008 [Candidatus Moranbacteria bacterium GW2011_GWF2_37_7]KKQ43667.1 MAG: hypothetical protein US61_C0006G0015 [Parcubacteria group bacterium GW2011_GWE2_37_8]KKQ51390.1 MAG: hypothetical protein US71_C0012G0006 [Parcubacteria group bacterium GW2011_GWD2_38_12]KKQ58444.1 MAG: hypothetical protein US79_C0007G0010 [Parcubacteria group bacterium GW2011_GWC1_
MFELLEEFFYPVFSVSTVVLAVLAVYFARKAMHSGLTYSTVAATVWTLSILAVARIWHFIYETLELKGSLGEWVEIVEYSLFIIAYAMFIWIVIKSLSVKIPEIKK